MTPERQPVRNPRVENKDSRFSDFSRIFLVLILGFYLILGENPRTENKKRELRIENDNNKVTMDAPKPG